MQSLPDTANRLIEEFSRLPGIGRKTAQRLTFHLLKTEKETVYRLSDVLKDIKMKVHECSVCGGITEEDPCIICTSSKRNKNLLCIVEEAPDIYAFERTNSFNGYYHVLGGALSPLDGIGTFPSLTMAMLCFADGGYSQMHRHASTQAGCRICRGGCRGTP